MLEGERGARLRGLAAKSAQALALLQLLATNNLGRLAARADEQARTQLKDLVRLSDPWDFVRGFTVLGFIV